MSSSSRHKLSFVKETTFGVTPTNPTLLLKKHTGTTLAQTKGTVASETIDPSRSLIDFRHTVLNVAGDVSFEMHYGGHDDLLASLLFSSGWAAKFAPYAASTISAQASDNSLNDSANLFPELDVGDAFTIAGFTGTVGNNQTAKVISRTASKIVVETATPLVDDAAGESVTLTTTSQAIVNGVTRETWSILRQYTDMDGSGKPYHLFKGCMGNTFSLTLSPEALIKATIAFLGRECVRSTSAPSGATFTAAATTKAFNAFSGGLYLDGESFASATELSLTAENGVESNPVLFSNKTDELKDGIFNLTGSLTSYFKNSDALEMFDNETEFVAFFRIVDPAGNAYAFKMPRCKFTGGQADVSGQSKITTPLPFQALQHATLGYTLQITRTPA